MTNDSSIVHNQAVISGKVVSELTFSHEIYGEGFYYFTIATRRLSGIDDKIPVMVSERLADKEKYALGEYVRIEGQFRSYNVNGENGLHLQLMIFAREVFFGREEDVVLDTNKVFLTGYICKPPIYRTTPFNREIGDILLAVNRAYSKSDYIPCVLWGRNARYGGKLKVGDNIKVEGRFQSRDYQKKLPDGSVVNKVAYELSVAKIEGIKPENTENTEL